MSGWVLAGRRRDIESDGASLTIDLLFPAGLSLTVQNFRGSLRAFWNVCSHRATKMRDAGLALGPLRCPYHGWTYNADGVPVGIPENDPFFGLDAAARRSLALRPAGLAEFGDYLLLNADAGAAEPQPAECQALIRAHPRACDSGT